MSALVKDELTSSPRKSLCVQNVEGESKSKVSRCQNQTNIKKKLSDHVYQHKKKTVEATLVQIKSEEVADHSHVNGVASDKDGDNGLKKEKDDTVCPQAAAEADENRNPSPPSEGNLIAGSHILSNKILDEVLNEKKLALLQSPEVIQFLKQKQKENCRH